MALKIKKSVKESKEPRIVEYISPERKEILDRIRIIDNKWYSDVTEDDIKFLRDNGLDWNRGIIKDGKPFEVPSTYYYGDKYDFLDAADKHAERGTAGGYRNGPTQGSGQKNRTSDELKRAARELKDAKRWGTTRQQKVWQGKYDREEARLANLRKDAENKAWRGRQNVEMQEPYDRLKRINQRLKDNPDDDSWDNFSYDAQIRRTEKEKREREEELLKRYADELQRYQDRIDRAKQDKKNAIDWKNKILKKTPVEVKEEEFEEVEESCKVNESPVYDLTIGLDSKKSSHNKVKRSLKSQILDIVHTGLDELIDAYKTDEAMLQNFIDNPNDPTGEEGEDSIEFAWSDSEDFYDFYDEHDEYYDNNMNKIIKEAEQYLQSRAKEVLDKKDESLNEACESDKKETTNIKFKSKKADNRVINRKNKIFIKDKKSENPDD